MTFDLRAVAINNKGEQSNALSSRRREAGDVNQHVISICDMPRVLEGQHVVDLDPGGKPYLIIVS